MVVKKTLMAVPILMLVCLSAFSNPAWNWVQSNISLLSEASYEGDFLLFAFQKDDDFREKYSSESNMNLDLALLGVKEKFFWMFRSEIRGGYGESPLGMVFHPYDASFAIIPTFEYRLKRMHISAGLDHRCFHIIDQRPPEPIVYWNKFIVTLNSPHRREHPFVGRYIDDGSWNGFNRLIWSFTWGYYIREFFDLVEPRKLMTIKRPHYLHDFELKARYVLVRWKWGAVALTGASMFGYKHSGGGTYWAQQTGAEALFALRPFDTSLFVNYILDEGRFNSKDRLLEYGIRVVK
jgi:hypothetical protein